MKLLDTTYTLLTPVQAEALAAALQAQEEDGWTYHAKHDPKGTGYSFIEMYDDNKVFVGRF